MGRRWWPWRRQWDAHVWQAVADLPGGGEPACDRLLELLARVDAGRDPQRSRAALQPLMASPAALLAADHHARRSGASRVALDAGAAAFDTGAPGPIAVALAALHRDGRVRERAVRAMLERPDPLLAPLLVLRAEDWVRQVRERAGLGVAVLLAEEPATYLPVMLPVALRIEARYRSAFVMRQLVAGVLAAPPEVRDALARTGPTAQRRLVFDLDRAQGRLDLARLVAAAETDPDPRIRAQAAEAACRDAVWTEQVTVLRRLAQGRRTEVRVTALAGLLRLGRHADVAAHLDDPATLVRAVAREGARRAGSDATAHYRDAVSGGSPTPGTVAGFAETAPADLTPLLRLLPHPDRAVRAEAVRSLARLGGVTLDRVGPLLRDPAPSVVRAVAAALRPLAGRLPQHLAWDLLADPRPELRRAGYRLLTGAPPVSRLRAALTLALDPLPELARRGRGDTAGLVRAAGLGALTPTAAERADLEPLVRRAAPQLDGPIGDLLRERLGPP